MVFHSHRGMADHFHTHLSGGRTRDPTPMVLLGGHLAMDPPTDCHQDWGLHSETKSTSSKSRLTLRLNLCSTLKPKIETRVSEPKFLFGQNMCGKVETFNICMLGVFVIISWALVERAGTSLTVASIVSGGFLSFVFGITFPWQYTTIIQIQPWFATSSKWYIFVLVQSKLMVRHACVTVICWMLETFVDVHHFWIVPVTAFVFIVFEACCCYPRAPNDNSMA